MMRNEHGKVRVMLPPGMAVSHVTVPGETITLEHDDGNRTMTDAIPVVDGAVWVSPAAALDLLDSPTSPFRSVNEQLLTVLRAKAEQEGYTSPNKQRGVRVVDVLAAAEDARPSLREEMQRFKAARDAGLRELLRGPR